LARSRYSLGESAEGTRRRVQVASTNAPTCVKLRIEFVQRNDAMIPHDWQIDMAEALLLGLDCSLHLLRPQIDVK
jgi:hypothetical protein